MAWTCLDCGLPDPHHGDGDGNTTCACDRCYWCAGPPLTCDCEPCDDCERTQQADWAFEDAL